MAVPAQPVAVERRPIEVDDHSAEWWRDCDIAQLEVYVCLLEDEKRVQQRIYDEARYTLTGDPDATAAEIELARVREKWALVAIAQFDGEQYEIELEIEQIRAAPIPPPVAVSSPSPVIRLPVSRSRSRPRERRPGRRRRSSSSASSDDSDSDGEPASGRVSDRDVGPRHIAVVLGGYLAGLQRRAA